MEKAFGVSGFGNALGRLGAYRDGSGFSERPRALPETSKGGMQGTSLKDKAIKGAITGAIAGVASNVIFGEAGNTSLFGMNMPIPVAIGVTNGIASVAADVAHEYVLPHIPGNAKYTQVESAVLGLGVSGVGTALLLSREGLDMGTFMNGALLGAASYAAGDWIDSKFLGASSDLMLY